MKNGKFNKSEIASVARAYLEISNVMNALPASDPQSVTVRELLLQARHPLGDLLRWQDFDCAWQKLKDL
jgi:hypothetical protein